MPMKACIQATQPHSKELRGHQKLSGKADLPPYTSSSLLRDSVFADTLLSDVKFLTEREQHSSLLGLHMQGDLLLQPENAYSRPVTQEKLGYVLAEKMTGRCD